jgi:hypothetical protein
MARETVLPGRTIEWLIACASLPSADHREQALRGNCAN